MSITKQLRCHSGYIEVVERGRQGAKGETGLIEGGEAGDVLSKVSDIDGDFEWIENTVDNTEDANVPVKSGGTFENSGLYKREDGDLQACCKIIAEGGLITPGATLELGEGLDIESSGPQLILKSKFTGIQYQTPYQSIDKTGTGDTFVTVTGAEANLVKQGVDDTILTSPLSFQILADANRVINALYIKTDGDINSLRFQVISDATGEPIFSYPNLFKYERDEGLDLVGAGIKKIDLFYLDGATPIRVLAGETFTIMAVWDVSTGNILGTVAGTTPYLEYDYQNFEFKHVALIEDLETPSGNRGYFEDEAALNAAVPVGNPGDSAVVLDPNNNVFLWNDVGAAWEDSGIQAGGDMSAVVYDTSGKAVDVYNMDNMDESTTKKILTSTERLKLQGIETGAEVNRTALELKTDYESNTDTNEFSDAEKAKLLTVETGAEANRTVAELKTDYESNADTNAFTNLDKSNVDINTSKISFPGWDHNTNNAVTGDPTGFPISTTTGEIDLAKANMSFNNLTRTFSIEPSGVEFSFYEKGIKYTKTIADDVVIDDIEGLHYIYFDGGTLFSTTIYDLNIIYSKPFTAVLYWDQTNQEAIYVGEERHGVRMDGHTHIRLHQKDGTILIGGLGLNSFNIGTGSIDNDAQFEGIAGSIKDEDILILRDPVAKTTGMPIFYKQGLSGNWRRDFNSGFSVETTGTGRIAWNEFTGITWQKSEVPNDAYTVVHVFASNDLEYPYIAVMGQDTYGTLTEARDGAFKEISSLATVGLPFLEFVTVGSVIFQTSDSYVNSVKARVVPTSDTDNYADWRLYGISPNGVPPISAHNDLVELQGGVQGERYHLSAAQVSNIVFGTEYQIEEDNTETSNSDATWATKATLTTPSIPAGTYRVQWSAGVSHTGTNSAAGTAARARVDVTNIIGEFQSQGNDVDDTHSVGNFTTLVLAEGIHTVDIQFREVSTVAGAALMNQARIELFRVS